MKIPILGSHREYNLDHYVYMNLIKLGHEVMFYGYRERLGRLASPVRMSVTRSNLVRNITNLVWFNNVNREMRDSAKKFSLGLARPIDWFKTR